MFVTTVHARRMILLVFFLLSGFSVSQASAEWRQEIGVFRIGIVSDDRSQGSLFRYEPFKAEISEALGMEVEFFQVSSTEAIIDALASGRIEYALMSSMGFALGWTICECVEPIVLPRSKDSTDSYRLIAIGRASAGISLDKLQDHTVAFTSEDAISGIPLVSYLLATGTPQITIANDKIMRFNTGDEARDGFGQKQIDVLFGWSSMTGFPKEGYSRGTLRQLIESGKVRGTDMSVIWQSEPIPHRPHVIRKNLPGELKAILGRVLGGLLDTNPLAYDSIEPVYAGGFVTTTQEKYETLIRFLSSIKENRAVPVAPPDKSSEEKEQDNIEEIPSTD